MKMNGYVSSTNPVRTTHHRCHLGNQRTTAQEIYAYNNKRSVERLKKKRRRTVDLPELFHNKKRDENTHAWTVMETIQGSFLMGYHCNVEHFRPVNLIWLPTGMATLMRCDVPSWNRSRATRITWSGPRGGGRCTTVRRRIRCWGNVGRSRGSFHIQDWRRARQWWGAGRLVLRLRLKNVILST